MNRVSMGRAVGVTHIADVLEQIAKAETRLQIKLLIEQLKTGLLKGELEMTDEDWDEVTKTVRFRLYGPCELPGCLP